MDKKGFTRLFSSEFGDLLPEILSSGLRTCKEITDFCTANKDTYGFCKQDMLSMLKMLAKSKAPRLNIDVMMYKMMCQIIEKHSSSEPGDYLNGRGMYQKQLQNFPERRIGSVRREGGGGTNIGYKYSDVRDALMKFAEYYGGKPDNIDWDEDIDVIESLDAFPAVAKHPFLKIIVRTRLEKQRAAAIAAGHEVAEFDEEDEDEEEEGPQIRSRSADADDYENSLIKPHFDSFVDVIVSTLTDHLKSNRTSGRRLRNEPELELESNPVRQGIKVDYEFKTSRNSQ